LAPRPCDRDKTENGDQGKRVSAVQPPPWYSVLFVALLIVALAAIVALALRNRMLRRTNAGLRSQLAERAKELRWTVEEMKRLALQDRLTGLGNRRRFQQELERMAARAGRTGQDFCLVVTDLDSFKEANDRLGHSAGDEILRIVAARLSEASRLTDLVCRYGGDEFVTLGWSGSGRVGLLAERMRAALSASPCELPDGVEYSVRASFGVCSWIEAACDTGRLFTQADRALYVAKRRGDAVVRWAPDLAPATVVLG
jgi:diguanylate cyclase (GGDEF)-like protein